MSAAELRVASPQDLVAIFHASFHPTLGNIVDWSVKASECLDLEHLEFNALPSGLHLVEKDVVYFAKNGHQGVCIFRKRKTTEDGHRGFLLSSLGILLAKSKRPRAWKHVESLKQLVDNIYNRVDGTEPTHPRLEDWDQARVYFDGRKVQRTDLGGAGDWNGWTNELDSNVQGVGDTNPTLHLPHLLRILGPSSLTLYKHVLGRRRILIYTLPPVEAACILCQVAADMCYDYQIDTTSTPANSPVDGGKWKGRTKEPINVLGMVTLNDLDRLLAEGQTGKGWIACTTDAIFLERPSFYDLLIDLTTLTPSKDTRPTFYCSKAVPPAAGSSRSPTHRLSVVRFSWSDVKQWNKIDRILQLDSPQASHPCCTPCSLPDSPTKVRSLNPWTDTGRLYEDVCLICAALWTGSWRNNSLMSYSTSNGSENWGAVRLEGDDDLTPRGAYVRNVGMGIEGGLRASSSGVISSGGPIPSPTRRVSVVSLSSGRATLGGAGGSTLGNGKAGPSGDEMEPLLHRDSQIRTTLALLQTFHAHTSFQLSVLQTYLLREGREGGTEGAGAVVPTVLQLSPRDVMALELGPLSSVDARYLEWLAEEYAGGSRVVVRRGWRDLLGAVFGY